MPRPTKLASWQALKKTALSLGSQHLSQLHQNQDRFQNFCFRHAGILLDISKQRLNEQALNQLLQLAQESQLSQQIHALMHGEQLNISEKRPALHTALRLPASAQLKLAGTDINPAIQASLNKMEGLVARLHAGQARGVTGLPIQDIVNLGVGGSDLGPLMVSHALHEFRPAGIAPLRLHFASTIDGSQLAETLRKLNPATTLFIIASKSFTTLDTLSNAETAKHWLVNHLGNENLVLKQHFIGISALPEKMQAWGIAPEHQLEFWDWVGGRFSLWSAIGLPIALQIGMHNFRQFLAGAHNLDVHFAEAEFKHNLPVLLALAGIWNINFLNINAHSVLPYDGRLKYFPAYLTQLEMESNGKSSTLKGELVDYATCPVLWGELGPNAQHAFYQLLHQGTEAVNCDFIAPVKRYQHIQDPATRAHFQHQHQLALANCFAQSRLLALGDAVQADAAASQQAEAHKTYRGNQPSTSLLIDELTPFSLGQLIALYEHKVFVQATIWQINPFDQWGVELGKKIALNTQQALEQKQIPEHLDPSTQGLLAHCLALQNEPSA